jgi:NADPH-dependent F420 reductase
MSETTGAGSKRIAILGGTGALGTGLVRRWTQAGHAVIIGSRTLEKAETALAELKQVMAELGATKLDVAAMENLDAARAADIVVLTVPFAHQKSTLEHVRPALEGKILVDVTVPLMPPKVGTVQLPPEGSAGMAAQQLLGDGVKVVSAFQNVAAHHLQEGHGIECDVLVCGNDKDARAEVIGLVEACGMRGFHAGPIANSAAAEALTSVIININRAFKCHAGIRITGLDSAGE